MHARMQSVDYLVSSDDLYAYMHNSPTLVISSTARETVPTPVAQFAVSTLDMAETARQDQDQQKKEEDDG